MSDTPRACVCVSSPPSTGYGFENVKYEARLVTVMLTPWRRKRLHALLSAGHADGEEVRMELGTTDTGMLTVSLNGNRLLECTPHEAMFVLMALSRAVGRELSRDLVSLTPDTPWRPSA